LGEIRGEVEYYYSAFLIYCTCMYTATNFAKIFLGEKVFREIRGVEYYNSAFLIYCMYTSPYFPKNLPRGGSFLGNFGGS